MTFARIAILIAIAAATTTAFAATSDTDTPRGHTAWYEAGNRVLQGEQQRQQLEREGFPQYVD